MSDSAPGSKRHLVPPPLAHWLESSLGGTITHVVPRAGGGAVRMGAEVAVRLSPQRTIKGFLAYDGGSARQKRDVAEKYVREAAILSALEDTPVRAPRLLATSSELRAHFFEFVLGEDRFSKLTNPNDAQVVAADFLHDLVLLHKLDARSFDLPGFGPILPVRDVLAARIDELRREHDYGGVQDAMIVFGLEWLERRMPAYDERPAIVHGDAGPGNFLFENGAMTAMLDWEQCHFGDPMEDFAWMSIRGMIQAWVPFPRLLETYEALSGIMVDLDRIRYYRVYTLLGMIVGSHRRFYQQPETLATQSRLGGALMFTTLHRLAFAQGLADAEGISLPESTLPKSPAMVSDPFIASQLAQLRETIVPRSEDQVLVETAKDMARVLKYIDARNRLGESMRFDELDDLNRVLRTSHKDLAEARGALLDRVLAGKMSDADMIHLIWRRVERETMLAHGVIGRLAERSLAPLVREPDVGRVHED